MTQAKAALFLDRDGVINVDHGYVHRIEDFQFVDGIFELCGAATTLGYRLIVITNQAGIARGYYSEAEFHSLMTWLGAQFSRHHQKLTAYYFCPDHPDGKPPYRRRSFMRKPGPGMLFRAADDHDLDLAASVFIGDQPSDIEAGRRAGVGAAILYAPDGADGDHGAEAIVGSHREAAHWLQGWNERQNQPGSHS